MQYLGTCISAFDEDGDAFDQQNMIYQNVTEFAQNEEKAIQISSQDFIDKTNLHPDFVKEYISDKQITDESLFFLYDKNNQMIMIYDDETDIHYFFSLNQNDLKLNKIKHNIINNVDPFKQFKNAPSESFLIFDNGINRLNKNYISFYIKMRPFEGIDYSKINTYTYGPFNIPGYSELDGNVTLGGENEVTILFRAKIEPELINKKTKSLEI